MSAGLSWASTTIGSFRWVGRTAGLLVLSCVVIGGLAIGAQAAWIGPIFFLVSFVTNVMVEAVVRRDEPMFLASSYWRRILLVSRGYKSEPVDAAGEADRPRARIDGQ